MGWRDEKPNEKPIGAAYPQENSDAAWRIHFAQLDGIWSEHNSDSAYFKYLATQTDPNENV